MQLLNLIELDLLLDTLLGVLALALLCGLLGVLALED